MYQIVDSNSSGDDNLKKLAVGDLYGGVIVFYVAENGLSGLGVVMQTATWAHQIVTLAFILAHSSNISYFPR